MSACAMCDSDTGRHPAGTVLRQEPCGCTVAGIGLLPNPWHVHYCAMHAAAADLLTALNIVVRVDGPITTDDVNTGYNASLRDIAAGAVAKAVVVAA